jgi:acyl-coenzyme A synthetase/AMP-(fatty) acid ligase
MGYYNNPEKTAEAFVQNPLQSAYPELVYRTGDIAYRNAHGELVFVCRKDSQIKHMGHRIELGEIEAAAMKTDGVSSACCLYDAGKKQIVLFYVGAPEKNDLAEALKAYLPRYMLPAICEKLDRMPLTPNGKKDRKTLAARMNF